jgi:hypothetical protein
MAVRVNPIKRPFDFTRRAILLCLIPAGQRVEGGGGTDHGIRLPPPLNFSRLFCDTIAAEKLDTAKRARPGLLLSGDYTTWSNLRIRISLDFRIYCGSGCEDKFQSHSAADLTAVQKYQISVIIYLCLS